MKANVKISILVQVEDDDFVETDQVLRDAHYAQLKYPIQDHMNGTVFVRDYESARKVVTHIEEQLHSLFRAVK